MNRIEVGKTYEIRKGTHAPCELVSHVKIPVSELPGGLKWGGGTATNFIAEGTYTYCEEILSKVKGVS